MAAICAWRNGSHWAISSGSGLRLPGRPALHDVGDVDLFPREAHRLDDLREQLPRASDEGLALHVFVRAGPSPTNISVASGFPTPNTMCVRPLCSLQRVQSPISARISVRRIAAGALGALGTLGTLGALGR
jgi:hypothetical protein